MVGLMDTQTIHNLMQEIEFPINKEGLLEMASDNGMDDAYALFVKLPDHTFGNAQELLSKLPMNEVDDAPEM